jgi:selenide,water dikinase
MCRSNAAAGRLLREHGVKTCTDVTGFGITGHLREMAGGIRTRISLDLDTLPLLVGALDCLRAGVASTMQPKNEAVLGQIDCADALRTHPSFPLLFDPQTAGGLLAAVPPAQADACLAALHAAGYCDSAVIGTVMSCAGVGRLELGGD